VGDALRGPGREARTVITGTQTAPPDEVVLTLDRAELDRLDATFAAPRWLRHLGRTSWLLVGALLVLIGLMWLLAEMGPIVNPVAVALIVAVVASPIVGKLAPHLKRAGAAAVVLLGAVILAVAIVLLVVGGIQSQRGAIGAQASAGLDKITAWLADLGMSTSGTASVDNSLHASIPQVISTLVDGVIHGIGGIASLAFGLSLAALSLFFLLRDGPTMRRWIERHVGMPPSVAHVMTGGVITALRRYFRGVTIVALFNAVVVFIGAILLDVPLAGTIAIVTFVTAYVPYIGAFIAGGFAVVLALGAQGTTVALIMLVVVLLANGLLQNLVQPFAMGAALDLNPLVVLILTIGAGCLFGGFGLVLAAPLASAAVHIARDLAAARTPT
jgi:predicted PurR-regulated permease PerM